MVQASNSESLSHFMKCGLQHNNNNNLKHPTEQKHFVDNTTLNKDDLTVCHVFRYSDKEEILTIICLQHSLNVNWLHFGTILCTSYLLEYPQIRMI